MCFVDLDGTLLDCSSEKEFLHEMARRHVVPARRLLAFATGYLLHPLRTLREGKGWNRLYLRGLEARIVMEEAGRFARDTLAGHVRPALRAELMELAGSGTGIALISASLDPLARSVGECLGAHVTMASVLESCEGRLTGRLTQLRPWGRSKAALAKRLAERSGIPMTDCVAYGDSWPDRFFMSLCGEAVAVHPSARLLSMARSKGWRIITGEHVRWA